MQYNFFLSIRVVPLHCTEAFFNRLNLPLAQKSWFVEYILNDEWTRYDFNFLGYANVELLAKLSYLDDRLACHKLFNEIELLYGFESGLANKGLKWMKRQEEDDDYELMEELKIVLDKIKQNGPRPTVKTNKVDTPGVDENKSFEDLEALTITERQDMDMTDLLWDVLKKVQSLEELKTAWEFALITFKYKREEIRPYVSDLCLKFIRSTLKGFLLSAVLWRVYPDHL